MKQRKGRQCRVSQTSFWLLRIYKYKLPYNLRPRAVRGTMTNQIQGMTQYYISFLKKSHLFLAVLDLHCCNGPFSSCGEWGWLSSCSVRASHCRGFSCAAQALGGVGFNTYTYTQHLRHSSCRPQAAQHLRHSSCRPQAAQALGGVGFNTYTYTQHLRHSSCGPQAAQAQ